MAEREKDRERERERERERVITHLVTLLSSSSNISSTPIFSLTMTRPRPPTKALTALDRNVTRSSSEDQYKAELLFPFFFPLSLSLHLTISEMAKNPLTPYEIVMSFFRNKFLCICIRCGDGQSSQSLYTAYLQTEWYQFPNSFKCFSLQQKYL